MSLKARISVLLFLTVCVLHAGQASIAVHDLIPQGMEQHSAALISDRLRAELFKTGSFVVLERGQMEEILKEQGFQQSGCVSDQCAMEVGQLLGVGHIIVGSIGKLGKTYTMNVRMLDVQTGQIVETENVDCKCEIDEVLSSSTRDMAEALSKSWAAQAGSAQDTDGDIQTDVDSDVETVAAEAEADAQLDKAEKDAVDKAGGDSKRRRVVKLVARIGSGVVAVGGAAAGVFLNTQAENYVAEAEAIQSNTTSANYATQAPAYADNYSLAESSMTYRNISYIAAGLGVVGFGVTFIF